MQCATPEIKEREQRKYADDCDPGDPVQIDFVKNALLAADWLLEHIGLHIRNRSTALKSVKFIKELLLGFNAGRRIDQVRLLLCAGRTRKCDYGNEQDKSKDGA
jgi:hypothetical protein